MFPTINSAQQGLSPITYASEFPQEVYFPFTTVVTVLYRLERVKIMSRANGIRLCFSYPLAGGYVIYCLGHRRLIEV